MTAARTLLLFVALGVGAAHGGEFQVTVDRAPLSFDAVSPLERGADPARRRAGARGQHRGALGAQAARHRSARHGSRRPRAPALAPPVRPLRKRRAHGPLARRPHRPRGPASDRPERAPRHPRLRARLGVGRPLARERRALLDPARVQPHRGRERCAVRRARPVLSRRRRRARRGLAPAPRGCAGRLAGGDPRRAGPPGAQPSDLRGRPRRRVGWARRGRCARSRGELRVRARSRRGGGARAPHRSARARAAAGNRSGRGRGDRRDRPARRGRGGAARRLGKGPRPHPERRLGALRVHRRPLGDVLARGHAAALPALHRSALLGRRGRGGDPDASAGAQPQPERGPRHLSPPRGPGRARAVRALGARGRHRPGGRREGAAHPHRRASRSIPPR